MRLQKFLTTVIRTGQGMGALSGLFADWACLVRGRNRFPDSDARSAMAVAGAALVVFLLCFAALEPSWASGRPNVGLDDPLVLLPGGQTLGVTRFGSASLDDLGDSARMRLDDAIEAGLGGFTLYVDWPELEPTAGNFQFDRLLEDLDSLHARGLKTFLNITVGDIGERNLPSDLPADVEIDAPVVLSRFGALLDQLVPELAQRGVFLLGLGNEIDDRLDSASDSERAAYVTFVNEARSRIMTLEPDLPVAITLTAAAVRDQGPTFQAMQSAVDLTAVNFAPIDPDFFVLEPSDIRASLLEVLAAIPEGPIVIQELTCPSAEPMGASANWQGNCFDILLRTLRSMPRFRFASIFTLSDFEAELCDAVISAFPPLMDVPADFRERFEAYLCALGILQPDGEPKPVWSSILEHLQRQRSVMNRSRRARSAGIGLDPGLHERTLTLNGSAGASRRYRVHVPESAPPRGGWPLVVVFHGGGGTATNTRLKTGWDILAETENFVVAFGEGTRPDPDSPPAFADNGQTWNDGSQREAIGAIERGEDDVNYVRALLEDLQWRLPINPRRIHATGFSNGAGMTFHAARSLPGQFASIAPVAGADAGLMPPELSAPISLLYMTGTSDPLNPVDGGEVFLLNSFLGVKPPVDEQLARWRTALDCPRQAVEIELGDSAVNATRFAPCVDGSRVELWLLQGHGHHWPGGLLEPALGPLILGPNTAELDATGLIWSFFRQTAPRFGQRRN